MSFNFEVSGSINYKLAKGLDRIRESDVSHKSNVYILHLTQETYLYLSSLHLQLWMKIQIKWSFVVQVSRVSPCGGLKS